MPVWDTLPDDAKRLYARMMEVYAGFVSFTDYHFGRILDFLKEIGELDNTLIMVISDNGASSEGGPTGSLNEMCFFNNLAETMEDNLKQIDKIGGVEVFNHYAWGWTNAGNTPFRRWKRETYRGGTTDPCIVSWPKGIQARGEMRTQYAHIIDLVPTVLEALGVEAPESIRGVSQAPIDGISFAHTFNEAAAPSNHHTQYFEMFGHRALYHDGWRAVCPWPGPNFTEAAKKGRKFGSPISNEVLVDIESHDWELYHIDEDYSETHNLAAEHRDKLIEMIGRWWAEAGKYQVLPIDGSALQRMNVERPTIARPRSKYVYYAGGSPVPFSATPKSYNRPWSITAEVVIPQGGAEGVLLAHGGRTGGYTLFVKDQKLRFLYNFLNRDKFWLTSNETCRRAKSSCATSSSRSASLTLPMGKACRRAASSTSTASWLPASTCPTRSWPCTGRRACLAAMTAASPVAAEEYTDEFRFTGTIKRVTIDLSGELIPDTEADMKIAMTRQ